MRMSQQAVMLKPPPTAKPWICAITGLLHALEPGGAGGAVALVGEAVLGVSNTFELADVGAGHEGLAAGAAQDEDAHGVVRVHLLADLSSRSYMTQVIALRVCGRLKVSVVIGPSRVTSASGC